MTVFAAVIAVTKDLPDVEGDASYGVDTLATRFGVKRVAAAATAVLGANYAAAVAAGLRAAPGAFKRAPMVAGHALLGLALLRNFRAYATRGAENADAVKAYYKSIWDLFYLEYLLYVFI